MVLWRTSVGAPNCYCLSRNHFENEGPQVDTFSHLFLLSATFPSTSCFFPLSFLENEKFQGGKDADKSRFSGNKRDYRRFLFTFCHVW